MFTMIIGVAARYVRFHLLSTVDGIYLATKRQTPTTRACRLVAASVGVLIGKAHLVGR